jgi:uncharacterized protein YndB with AHSA1/START domain
MPGAAHFDLVSHWHLQAPPAVVWAALSQPEQWPQWWPQVRQVRLLREGDAQGLGALRRIDWTTRLPYRLRIEVEAVEVQPPERLRGTSRGHLRGEGLWLLREHEGGTLVTYLWRVRLERPWMRLLAPLLAPLFRWNHDAVMRDGRRGLARWLARAAFSPAR